MDIRPSLSARDGQIWQHHLEHDLGTEDSFELLFIHLENEDNSNTSLPGRQSLGYSTYLVRDKYHDNYYKGKTIFT